MKLVFGVNYKEISVIKISFLFLRSSLNKGGFKIGNLKIKQNPCLGGSPLNMIESKRKTSSDP